MTVDARIDLSRAVNFIPQVAENGHGAKRSCSLASQLNAYIAIGKLDQFTALDAQKELCDDPKYDYLWSPAVCGPERNWRAWHGKPDLLARILGDEYALDVPVPRVIQGKHYDLLPDIEDHLRGGGVAWLSGRSVIAYHARIAFEPAGFPSDQFFVHDPRYPETTDLYDYDELSYFQTGAQSFLYSN